MSGAARGSHERRRGDLLACRYSIFWLQDAFAAVEAFGRKAVPIPMTPEAIFSGEFLKLCGDTQGPPRVARGGYLLEARQRIRKLRSIVGATQRESAGFFVPVKLCASHRLLAVECSHADSKIEAGDVLYRARKIGQQPDDANRNLFIGLFELGHARHGRVGETKVLFPLSDLDVTTLGTQQGRSLFDVLVLHEHVDVVDRFIQNRVPHGPTGDVAFRCDLLERGERAV